MRYTVLNRYEGDNFVLDQQVVRAALKTYKTLFSSKPPSLSSLSPSSVYLRHLVEPPTLPSLFAADTWRNTNTAVLLLELRAALIVHEHAKNVGEGDTDASANQRVSKAVTEAFVAVQVKGMIESLGSVGSREREVVGKVFLLVSCFLFADKLACLILIFLSHSVSTHYCRRRVDRSPLLRGPSSN